MVTKDRYAIELRNGKFVRDEATDCPRIFTTKREAYLRYGPDANVVPVRCTFEIIQKRKKK